MEDVSVRDDGKNVNTELIPLLNDHDQKEWRYGEPILIPRLPNDYHLQFRYQEKF